MLGCQPSPDPEQTPPGPDPLGADTPPQTRPPGADAPLPRSRHPPDQTPPEADASIRSMSGRYASFWNAFLFSNVFPLLEIIVVTVSNMINKNKLSKEQI